MKNFAVLKSIWTTKKVNVGFLKLIPIFVQQQTTTTMYSACDIGNPIYERSAPTPDGGKGVAPTMIFFGSEDRSEKHLLPYEWQETTDGVKATVTKPLFTKYSNPCDLLFDVMLAIQEDLGRKINEIEWTW